MITEERIEEIIGDMDGNWIAGEWVYDLHKFARAIESEVLAKPAPIAPQAVDGWKLVPIEPTEEMLRAGFIDSKYDAGYGSRKDVWVRMLAAAPTANTPAVGAAPEVGSDNFIQPVPDHCDRIAWRNNYYHLPLTAANTPAVPDASLLRKSNEPLPKGCYCAPGKCAAPKPEWCRDAAKRDALATQSPAQERVEPMGNATINTEHHNGK